MVTTITLFDLPGSATPAPTVVTPIADWAALESLAFLYTATALGNNSGIRFMLTVPDAKVWCSSPESRGIGRGAEWAYFWTSVANWLRNYQGDGDAYGAHRYEVDVSKLEDNGEWDDKIAAAGVQPARVRWRTRTARRARRRRCAVSRPRDIGTKAETAVVRAAQSRGFPHAERRALRGRNDVGDILLCPGVIVEVKGGDMARKASDNLVASWLAETERERINANAEHAFLVVQRAGVGPRNAHHWRAYWTAGEWARLLGHEVPVAVAGATIRTSLESSLAALVANGWGGEA